MQFLFKKHRPRQPSVSSLLLTETSCRSSTHVRFSVTLNLCKKFKCPQTDSTFTPSNISIITKPFWYYLRQCNFQRMPINGFAITASLPLCEVVFGRVQNYPWTQGEHEKMHAQYKMWCLTKRTILQIVFFSWTKWCPQLSLPQINKETVQELLLFCCILDEVGTQGV